MIEFRWINTTLFVVLLLQFTAVTGESPPSFTFRAGEEATLPCENVLKNQDKCNSTSWLSSSSFGKTAEELISLGQISKSVISKTLSNRLSVAAKCSLVIKNVTRDNVGRYTCRQFHKLGIPQDPDSKVYLSVINITEHKNDDMVAMFCSVLTYEGCEHTVKWLYEGDQNEVEILSHTCSATVHFATRLIQKSKWYDLLKCNVTDNKSGETFLCNAGPQSSCDKTGSTTAGKNNTLSANDDTQGWWVYTIVAVGSAALLVAIINVAVIRRRKTKGNKTQMDDSMGLSLNPAVTQSAPEDSQDTVDPEDGVSYASISYANKTKTKAQDGEDAVTYSTVRLLSSSAGASADPSNLYATINKQQTNTTE